MPFEFTEHPRAPETQAAPNRRAQPPGKIVGIDMLDAPDVVPSPGLMHRRRPVWFWLGVALLLGAVIALVLVGLVAD
jgi:hypothetical protein